MSDEKIVNIKSKYVDDIFETIENEFKQIQSCIGMYISYEGTRGAMHLFKEIFNNALDECINESSPGNKVDVTYDETTGEIVVSDNGRGLPFDKMITSCTEKHTSTKFGRKFNKYSTGQNGVGLTVTTALCDYLIMTCNRGFEAKTIEFKDCVLNDGDIVKLNKEKYGTTIKFKPSEKHLGKIEISVDDIIDWLRRMSYILPEGIKIKFVGYKRGSEAVINREFKRTGLPAAVNFVSSSPEFAPILIGTSSEVLELEMAFTYDKTLDEQLIESYCNYVYTIDGGTHVTVCERAICDFMVREARKLEPNSKYEINYEDCKKGLVLILNCRHGEPKFGGQSKEKIDNKDIIPEAKPGLTKALYEFFNSNNSLLRRIVTYLRQMAKIRMEAHKIKGIDVKKPTSFLDDADIKGFWNITDRHSNGYRELLLTEGDSAAGAVLNVRNAKFQAVYALTGVVKNSFENTTSDILTRDSIKNLVKVIGCGIGSEYDINKLKWNRIIILTDADVDGSNITSLLCAFFVRHMPNLILEGRLFKSIPPLYLLGTKSGSNQIKNQSYIFDKREYLSIYHKIISNNVSVLLHMDNDEIIELAKPKLIEWLSMNSQYITELNNLVKRTAGNAYILEHVWYYKHISKNEVEFKERIEEKFPELEYDINEKSLFGSFNGTYTTLIIDDLFVKISIRFKNIFIQNPSFYVGYKNKNDNTSDYIQGTIGEFLYAMENKYMIDIDQRYKGIGEIESDVVFASTLNPKIRKLIKLTIDDMPNTLDIMGILHGKRDKNSSENRRKLLEEAEISYDDIDN